MKLDKSKHHPTPYDDMVDLFRTIKKYRGGLLATGSFIQILAKWLKE